MIILTRHNRQGGRNHLLVAIHQCTFRLIRQARHDAEWAWVDNDESNRQTKQ